MASNRFFSLLFLPISMNEKCTVPWLFSREAIICLQVDFYHLEIITGGLGSHCDLPQFNNPSFSSAVKDFGDFYKIGFEQLANAKWVCLWLKLPESYFSI